MSRTLPVAECQKCGREWGMTVDGAHAVALTGLLGDHATATGDGGFTCCGRMFGVRSSETDNEESAMSAREWTQAIVGALIALPVVWLVATLFLLLGS